MMNGEDTVGGVRINDELVFNRFGFVYNMDFRIDGIAVVVAGFEDDLVQQPIAAQTVDAEAFIVAHQPLGEETGEVTHATHNVAAEDVVGVAHTKHTESPIVIFDAVDGIHMHGEALHANSDLPCITHLGNKIVKCSELMQVAIPPIDNAFFLIDILMRHDSVVTLVV